MKHTEMPETIEVIIGLECDHGTGNKAIVGLGQKL